MYFVIVKIINDEDFSLLDFYDLFLLALTVRILMIKSSGLCLVWSCVEDLAIIYGLLEILKKSYFLIFVDFWMVLAGFRPSGCNTVLPLNVCQECVPIGFHISTPPSQPKILKNSKNFNQIYQNHCQIPHVMLQKPFTFIIKFHQSIPLLFT